MTNRICLSNDPICSGVQPCMSCFDFLLKGHVRGQQVWSSGGVLPRAMFLAGPPFNIEPGAAARLMQSYGMALRDGVTFLVSMVSADRSAQAYQGLSTHQPAPPAPSGESPEVVAPLTEEQHLLIFQAQILQALPTMSEADKLKMVKGVVASDLEGWALLSEGERNVLRSIFLPPPEVPQDEEEPLPSDESARKVVAAMRAGTLNANTLAPPEAPKKPEAPAQQDLAPGGAVAAPAGEKTDPGASPQAPGAVVGEAAGHANNGTNETAVPAQVAVTSQETTTS